MQSQAAISSRERRIRPARSLDERDVDLAINHLEWVHRTRRKIRCRALPFPRPQMYESSN